MRSYGLSLLRIAPCLEAIPGLEDDDAPMRLALRVGISSMEPLILGHVYAHLRARLFVFPMQTILTRRSLAYWQGNGYVL